MTRTSLNIKKVAVHHFMGVRDRAHGFMVPGKGEFVRGINIIYGPNASGKTTVGRAVHELLWPGAQDGARASVSGDWEFEGTSWKTIVDAGRSRWERAGRASSPPPMPPPEERRQYWLALHELLRVEDEDLAARIQHEIYGGLDIHRAARELGFETRIPKTTIKPYRRYGSAENEVREIARGQRELKRQEESLVGLRRELAAADAARENAAFYQALVELIDQATAVDLIQKQHDTFDPRLATFEGTELRAFEELSQRLNENCEAQLARERDLEEAQQRRDATGYSEETCPSPEELKALKLLLGQLQRKETDFSQAQKRIAGLSDKEAELGRAIGAGVNVERLSQIDAGTLARIKDFFRQVEDWRAEHNTAVRFKDMVAVADFEQHKLLRLERGCELLSNWLATASGHAASMLFAMTPSVIWLAISAVLAVLCLAILVDPWWLFAVVVPLLLVWWAAKPGITARENPEAIECEYNSIGQLPRPDAWQREQVMDLLQRLSADLAAARLEQLRNDAWRAEEQRLSDIERRRKALDKESDRLKEETGLPLTLDDTSLVYLTECVSAWQKVRADRIAADGEASELGRGMDRLIKEANEILERRGAQAVTDLFAFEAEVSGMEELAGRYREAKSQVAAVEKEQNRLHEEADTLLNRLNELLASSGLEKVDDSANLQELESRRKTLKKLHAEYTAYTKVCEEMRYAKRKIEEQRAAIKKYAEFTEDKLDFERAQAVERLDAAQEKARRADTLREKLAALESRIAEAKKQAELETALSERDEARIELYEARNSAAAAITGDIILQFILERHRENASDVLKQAVRNFSTITRGQWELDIGAGIDGTAAFAARDTNTGSVRALDELSSGTRVQLLLAIRLAFVELLEGEHPKLPLILDETLSNSDSERETAAMQALIEIARSGRQILYFTAQEDEVYKWMRLLDTEERCEYKVGPGVIWESDPEISRDQAGPVPCSVTMMTRSTFDFETGGRAIGNLPMVGDVGDVPMPDNSMSYDEYGVALNVPPWNPEAAACGTLHIWYVVTGHETLYKLLTAGYRTWGQLFMLLEHGGPEALRRRLDVSEPERVAIFAKGAAAIYREAGELQMIGRNRRISRAEVYRSPVQNSKFIDEVVACLEAVDGDPDKLLEALESKAVRGFGPAMIARLQAYLEEQGILDRRQFLSHREFRARLDAFVASKSDLSDLSREEIRQIYERIGWGSG